MDIDGYYIDEYEVSRISRTRTGRPIIYEPSVLLPLSSAATAFAAGLFEGEGAINYPRGSQRLTAIIAQSQSEPLMRVQDYFGGTIYWDKRGRRVSQVRRYRIPGDAGVVFLEAIYPWLSTRRKVQVDRGLREDMLMLDARSVRSGAATFHDSPSSRTEEVPGCPVAVVVRHVAKAAASVNRR